MFAYLINRVCFTIYISSMSDIILDIYSSPSNFLNILFANIYGFLDNNTQ